MALAFGVASGLGAIEGLYGAVVVGFLAAVFGGTKTVISGPTGPMAVAMAVIIADHADHDIGRALTIVVLAGVIQILLGLARIGRLVSYTPYSVISGFMSGIGVIIMVIQTLPFVGLPVTKGGPLEAIRQWPQAVEQVNWSAFVVALVTLGVGLAWPRRFHEMLPPVVAALLAGTLLSVLWLSDIPVIGETPTGLPDFRVPDLSPAGLLGDLQPALTIALLGAIDTLLTALIADSMTRERHNPNRELMGQGLGNTVAGLFGAVPGAGATMGTVVNIRAGARTRVAGALCALLLLAVALSLGRYVESIPHAVLAGILIKVGWDIVDWRFMTRLHRVQREHLLVMVVTLGLTVFADLVTEVVLGLVAAGMASARQFERLELESVISVPLLDDAFLTESARTEESDKFSARVGLVALRGNLHGGLLQQADRDPRRRRPRSRSGDHRLLRHRLHGRQCRRRGRAAHRRRRRGGHRVHRHGNRRSTHRQPPSPRRARSSAGRPLRERLRRGTRSGRAVIVRRHITPLQPAGAEASSSTAKIFAKSLYFTLIVKYPYWLRY